MNFLVVQKRILEKVDGASATIKKEEKLCKVIIEKVHRKIRYFKFKN
jgi:hypothetical protein